MEKVLERCRSALSGPEPLTWHNDRGTTADADFHSGKRAMGDYEVMSKRRSRRLSDPAAPLVRPRPRLGPVAVAELSSRLRDVLEENIPETSALPAAEELYWLLVYAEQQARRVRDGRRRADAAVDRVMLWQWLREQIDAHQLRAVDDARADGVEWARLVRPLGVETVPGAYNKVRRMRADQAAEPGGPPIRRTPAAVTAALAARAAEEAEARARARSAADQADQVISAARLMSAQAGALLVDVDGDAQFWLEEMGEVLADIDTAEGFTQAQIASLAACLSGASRVVLRQAQRSGLPPAGSPIAQQALDAAVACGSVSHA